MFGPLRHRTISAALGAILIAPGAGALHTRLTGSNPAQDEVVREMPKEICLTFSARPEVALSDIKLASDAGRAVAVGKVKATADSLTIAAPVTGPVPQGKYTITWRTASKDGHVIRGRIGFTVGATAVAAPAAAATTPRPAQEHAHD